MSPADSSPDHAPADPVVLVAPALAVAGQPALVEPSFGERYRGVLTGLAMLLAGGGLLLAWKTEQRVAALEQELVKRQQDSAGQAVEAKSIAKEAQQSVLAVASKQALLEVRVALVGIAPGVDDGDHRLAHPVGRRIAHLHDAGPVAKAAEVVGGEPARAAQLGWRLHSTGQGLM